MSRRELYDYGPEFDRGIISILPPVPTVCAYTTLVPKVNADGIDLAGMQLPDIAVPLGTYTGWNLLASAPKDECSAMGSFIPFAKCKEQRIAAGDPRPSLEERYATRSRYVKAVAAAAERLVSARLLLPEDAIAYVDAARKRDRGLPRVINRPIEAGTIARLSKNRGWGPKPRRRGCLERRDRRTFRFRRQSS